LRPAPAVSAQRAKVGSWPAPTGSAASEDEGPLMADCSGSRDRQERQLCSLMLHGRKQTKICAVQRSVVDAKPTKRLVYSGDSNQHSTDVLIYE